MTKSENRHRLLGIALCLTIIGCVGVLSFSVSTFFDKLMFLIMLTIFVFCVILDLKEDKKAVLARMKGIFQSAKILYIVLALYFIWDVITILYTRDLLLSVKKFPYMIEYVGIFLASVYYCKITNKIVHIIISVALTGTLVSIGTYLYYFLSQKPIYFQRLSTARDYNVYASIIIFGIIFASVYLMNYCKLSFFKRILIYTAVCVVNMPTFYFAGSRRMAIMVPYFFLFAVLFEVIRLMVSKTATKRILFENLAFLSIIVVIFFITSSSLPIFSKFGAEKEAAYKAWLANEQSNGIDVPTKEETKDEKTISAVLETISDKSMYSKRSLIYSVAFNELKDYNVTEWIFGRGAAYDLYMYDTTTDEALLKAYSIDKDHPRPKGWLSVHNFTLADLLNGGLIKLILGLTLVGTIIAYMIRAIQYKKRIGIALVIPFALVFVNNFISGAYGMMNDVFFQIMLAVLCGIIYVNQKEKANV
ncbi:hypothetical protein RBG61_11400 [Paludicola sp. MB14-C6]|uniref:hypothetical protein n=1 Tax=Paludihabitans sp. MB14-C6 TaxID=3070656 RepID=UPI0027DD64FD|nr:hypothetical protein [Paludicola sp. MB14-C6]WMJ22588.1 hypothetical protein RBG61_11400 [Paludicola sp. MB14-C6]